VGVDLVELKEDFGHETLLVTVFALGLHVLEKLLKHWCSEEFFDLLVVGQELLVVLNDQVESP